MRYKRLPNIFDRKILIFQIILAAVFVGSILFFDYFFIKPNNDSATLLIDLENTKRMFEGNIVENMTILDALNASVAAGNIKLTYFVDNNNNTKIMEINDHIITGDRIFSFYVNNEKTSTEDLNKTRINPGDQVTIKLE